jgi:alcohol dehydrogenase class IV
MNDIRENAKKITNIAHASFPIRKFVAPEIILGDGSRNLINQYVLSLSGQKYILVTDPGVIKAGWAGR